MFIVHVGEKEETGRLIVDRRASRPGLALVAYATGIEEVEAAQIRIVRIE